MAYANNGFQSEFDDNLEDTDVIFSWHCEKKALTVIKLLNEYGVANIVVTKFKLK